MKLYFLFSSITFLQYYIPLVIEANKHKVDCVFIFRKNSRAYANPYDKVNHKIIKKYLDEYNRFSKIAAKICFCLDNQKKC